MPQPLTYLIYASKDRINAESISHKLENKGIEFIHNPAAPILQAALQNFPSTPIFLLLSDALLRSLETVELLQVFMKSLPEKIFVLLSPAEQGAEVPQIQDVHQVMRYRDFWYDEWIKLRRQTSQEENLTLEQHKEWAKAMSTHVHTLLRQINGLKPQTLEVFWQTEGRSFFEHLQRLDLFESRRAVTLVEPKSLLPPEKPMIEEVLISQVAVSETAQEDPAPAPAKLELEAKTETAVKESLGEPKGIEIINDLDVLFFMAETETEQGSYVQAQLCYERILQLDPTNGRALLWLARLFDRYLDQKALAEQHYRRALLFSESSAALFYEYALVLYQQGQYRRAIDLLDQAIEEQGQEAEYYLVLAQCRGQLQQITEAKAAYLQACLLNPDTFLPELEAQLKIFRPHKPEVAEVLEVQTLKPMENPNADTVVLVTGASSGIGRAIAEVFALHGYKVILTGRRGERLREVKKGLLERFEQAQIELLEFDVREPKVLAGALAALPQNYQNIDILINNAGLALGLEGIHEGDLAHWETMIDTNIKGLLYLTRAISPSMVARKKGHILNIGSIAGQQGYAKGAVYCATKAAVAMLTQVMRLDLAPHGVKVSALNPGHVETEFALVRFEQDAEKANIYGDFQPLRAEDVAEMAFFMLTRPKHVHVQDCLICPSQQASATQVERSGREEV